MQVFLRLHPPNYSFQGPVEAEAILGPISTALRPNFVDAQRAASDGQMSVFC